MKWLSAFYIGGKTNPYMIRWFVLPRNPWFNCYLHKFVRDDDDRALHDHPWWFVSIVLRGGYEEFDHINAEWGTVRRVGSIAFRPATHRHIVRLIGRKPCWTLVFTGPKSREWGFWCPKGFVVWTDFVAQDDEGNIGKGCGE